MSELKEWNARLLRLIDYWNKKNKQKRSQWDKKIVNIVTCWNIWHYQIVGQKPTLFTHPKRYFHWSSRLSVVNRHWNYQVTMTGWKRRCDYIRRTWADAGKQIKGGIGKMIEADIKNTRVGMNDLRSMLSKQNYQCALTGRKLTPENCSIDHIVPLCKGGIHSIENAQLVVAEVNHAKGSLTEEEFLQLCSDVVAYAGKKRSCVI